MTRPAPSDHPRSNTPHLVDSVGRVGAVCAASLQQDDGGGRVVMSESPRGRVPTGYRLVVDGQLDDHWSAWFGDLTLTRESDGTTSLSGFIADQAALHGVLVKVRDLGVVLLAVEVIDPSD